MQILNNIKFPEAKNASEANENLDKISSELWNKTTEIILKEQEIIVGLANRLVSDIKLVGCKVELSKEENEDLPSIKKRFQ